MEYKEQYLENVKKLRTFQVEGVNFLKSQRDCILADEQGLGKTVQVLMALGNKGLVVCPKSVKVNWKKECEKWRPDLKPIILTGRMAGLKAPNDGELVITNVDILPDSLIQPEHSCGYPTSDKSLQAKKARLELQNRKAKHKEYILRLAKDFEFVTLVIDEAHFASNNKTNKTNKVKWLSAISGRVWLLSGTPIKKGDPMKFYNLLHSTGMLEKIFGTIEKYLKCAGLTFNKYNKAYEQMYDPLPKFNTILSQYMLRRLKVDVAKEIPSKTIEYVECSIDNKEIRELLDERCKDIDYSSDFLPDFKDFSIVRSILAEVKFDKCLELIEWYEENEIPVIVFCSHVEPLERLKDREGWGFISGKTTMKRRQKIVDEQTKYKGLALSIKAVNTGITLTHFSNVIFIDMSYDTGENNQAFDRVHRISQVNPVSIKILVADHEIDRHLLKCLEKADKNVNMMIEGIYNE